MKKASSILLILMVSINLSACRTSKPTYSSEAEIKVEAQPQAIQEGNKVSKEYSKIDEAAISHVDIYNKQQQVSEKTKEVDNTQPTTDNSVQQIPKKPEGTDSNQAAVSNPVQQTQKPAVTQPVQQQSQASPLDTGYHEWGNIRKSDHTTPGIPSIIRPWMGKYNAIFTGDTSRKMFYFTFDAGGETGYANQIMDVLSKQGIKATFFVTKPYITNNSDIVKRMINEGHAVANHTVNHLGLPNLSDEQIKQEFEGVESEYTKVTGLPMMKCMRPPMGAYSEKSLYTTNQLGYKTVFWSIAYKDYDINNQPTREQAMSIIQDNHHNGAIVLLHLASKTNADTLNEMISFLKSQGYSFGLIS